MSVVGTPTPLNPRQCGGLIAATKMASRCQRIVVPCGAGVGHYRGPTAGNRNHHEHRRRERAADSTHADCRRWMRRLRLHIRWDLLRSHVIQRCTSRRSSSSWRSVLPTHVVMTCSGAFLLRTRETLERLRTIGAIASETARWVLSAACVHGTGTNRGDRSAAGAQQSA